MGGKVTQPPAAASIPVRAKLCGIRSRRDLEVALSAGADAVGFICGVTHRSDDALSEQAARELACLTPPYVSRVLVTHLQEAAAILGLAAFLEADTIQLHGLLEHATVAEVFAKAGRRVTKAIHVTGPEALEEAERYLDACDALHLDSRSADRLGGTGQVHDWSISRRIVELAYERAQLPVVLAGGLRPENVAKAIERTGAYAVDVNSGIEDEQGEKDSAKAAAFVATAHAAASAWPVGR